jgi:8-oxo-dGTP diphosphatase
MRRQFAVATDVNPPRSRDTMADPIRIAAALITDSRRLALVVRKQGTRSFMLAGGKIEAGETALDALRRELHEELELCVDADETRYMGRFRAPAAHEEGRDVEAEIFHIEVTGSLAPAAEIAEIAWVEPSAVPDLPLAALTRDHGLPLASRLFPG